MPRIVALDVGDATIGVAATDELNIAAHPIRTLHRVGIKADLRAVVEVLEELDACKVVVGMPVMLKGEKGVQAGKVQDFVDRLSKRVKVPIDVWDERLSTTQAERVLLESDASRSKRKKVIDKMAAAVILQGYMQASSEDKS